MATYYVDLPGGASVPFQAPDNATSQQLEQLGAQAVAGKAAPKTAVDTTSPAFQAKVAQAQADSMKANDPTNDMNWGQKALVNFGAGLDTGWEGAKDLAADLGWGKARPDEDIKEKRRIDEHLADKTFGGGVVQTAGEVVPGMVAGALAAEAAPLLAPAAGAAAIAPRMSVLAHTLRGMAPGAKMAVGGGLGGAAGAAMTPTTSDESRGIGMGMAGMLGAVVPGGAAIGGWGAKQLHKIFTESGNAKRAAEYLRESFPAGHAPRLDNVADSSTITAYNPSGRGVRNYEIPRSASQATDDPWITQAEARSRANPAGAGSWTQFDSARNAALHDVTQMAPSDLRMARLRAVREGRTGPTKNRAMEEAAQQGNYAEPVLAHVNQLVEGASGVNPAVQSIVAYVEKNLGPDARGAVSPERLHEVRKVLASKLGKTGPNDELGAAAKTAQRETLDIMRAIDKSLDDATGGQWTPYLQQYTQRSEPVASGRVLRETAEKMREKPYKGTDPEVTYHGYNKVLKEANKSKYGNQLTPPEDFTTRSLTEELKSGERAARTRKLMATQGGGSMTDANRQVADLGAKIIDAMGAGGAASATVAGAGRIARFRADEVERAVAQILQQPTRLAAALREVPPTYRQQLVEDALNAAGATSGAGFGAATFGAPTK